MNLGNYNYNKITTRQKFTIAVAVFLLFGFSAFYFLLRPTARRIEKLKADIITEKAAAEKSVSGQENSVILGDKLKKIEPELSKLDRIFISQNRELEFITILEAMAEKNGVEQKINLNIAAAKTEQNYKKIPLELNLRGNFPNLIRYLADLEASSYYANIRLLEISAGAGSGRGGTMLEARDAGKEPGAENLQMQITADTYWR